MRHAALIMSSVTAAILTVATTALAGEVNLSAAASLREVVNELAAGFSNKSPGVTFARNYGASGSLAKQIENGAPADIFISANLEWLEYLKNRKLLDDRSIDTFAYNELVFVGRPDLKTASLSEVVRLERIAIGSPKSVPA